MKGQSGIEIMIYVSMLILVFSVFMIGNLSFKDELFTTKSNSEAQKICDKIAFEINTAVKAGKGYERSFLVDNEFYGSSDFDIFIQEYTVFIDWDKGSVSSKIVIPDISGNITKGWNQIRNVNGIINVN